MLKLMRFLDEQRTSATVTVSLAVPHSSRGFVVLRDNSGGELTSFPVHRIRFCVRGRLDSAQKHCFSLSFTHHGADGEQTHQCHVFRSAQPDAVFYIVPVSYTTLIIYNAFNRRVIRILEKFSLFPITGYINT
ncbi:unnamed protein product [Angiostrongylus costaricensis]|uniref:PID domain-containing protein n=1 Tax=Angiostrongylus costaricensis TaxID=334426 RepID=A0A0R3PEK6_ANGCS|nr:unnamed protein product [Angiostrongylus costaricensis]